MDQKQHSTNLLIMRPMIPSILTSSSLSSLKMFKIARRMQIPEEMTIPKSDAFFLGILDINNSPQIYPKI